MWKNIAIVVLIILLLVTTYISYNNKQIGINYKVRSYEQYMIMKEAQKIINFAKPYYCHYAKDALKRARINIEQNSTYTTSCKQLIEDSTISPPTLEELKQFPEMAEFVEALNSLNRRFILSGCVNDKPNKEKILANLDLAYQMFCQDVATRSIPVIGEDLNEAEGNFYNLLA